MPFMRCRSLTLHLLAEALAAGHALAQMPAECQANLAELD